MQLYDYDKFSRNDIIGEVRSDMSKLDVSNSLEVWSDVHKQQKVGKVKIESKQYRK